MSDALQTNTLTSRLIELNLCSAQDLRLCRRKIRSLQKNLPIFESTWLDALFAIRRLTHFQVQTIEEEGPERLVIGPYRLIERPRCEPYADFYTARSLERPELSTIIRLKAEAPDHQVILERLAPYTQITPKRLSSKTTSLTPPITAQIMGDDIILVEAHTPGVSLADLLVRKGRFPTRLVEQIAYSVLISLEQLHNAGLPHGDLRSKNIILTRNGKIVLRHAGVTIARFPLINFHDPLPHDYFDAIPPELFLGQHAYSTTSDLFALGSLCWKLLCGRPAMLAVDPLIKLNRLTRDGLPEITDFNPDVSPFLAEFIRRTTNINPSERIASATEALTLFRRSKPRLKTSAAAKFVTSIPASLTSRTTMARTPFVFGYRHALAAATLLVSAGLIAWDQTQTPLIPLKLTDWIVQKPDVDETPTQISEVKTDAPSIVPEQNSSGFLGLPSADATNTIILDSTIAYEASPLKSNRSLTIQGADGTAPSTIVLRGTSWPIEATEVTLRNVNLRFESTTQTPAALLAVIAQNVRMENVNFVGPDESHPGICHAIVWRMSDLNDQSGGRCLLSECSLKTPGSAVVIEHHFGQVAFENTLHFGRGALVQMAGPIMPSRGLNLKVANSTLRNGGCLLRLDQLSPRELQGLVQIELNNSVIDIASSQGAMFLLTGNESPVELLKLIRVTGKGSVLAVGTPLAMWYDISSQQLNRLDEDGLQIDGLMMTSYTFSSDVVEQKSDSALSTLDGPRLSNTLPGISSGSDSIQPASFEIER